MWIEPSKRKVVTYIHQHFFHKTADLTPKKSGILSLERNDSEWVESLSVGKTMIFFVLFGDVHQFTAGIKPQMKSILCHQTLARDSQPPSQKSLGQSTVRTYGDIQLFNLGAESREQSSTYTPCTTHFNLE